MKRRLLKLNFNFKFPENSVLISLCVVFLLFLCVGAFSVNLSGTTTAQRLHDILTTPADNIFTSFFISFLTCAITYLAIFVVSTSAFGSLLVYLINAYRAFGLGFILGFLFKFYGSNGFLMGVVGVLPYSVLSSALLVLFSKYAVDYSLKMFYTVVLSKGQCNIKLSSYALQGLVILCFNIIPVSYETFISPLIFGSIT